MKKSKKKIEQEKKEREEMVRQAMADTRGWGGQGTVEGSSNYGKFGNGGQS